MFRNGIQRWAVIAMECNGKAVACSPGTSADLNSYVHALAPSNANAAPGVYAGSITYPAAFRQQECRAVLIAPRAGE